jgi:ubiquinone/menaquinone biosynthesis C-methylase UbiE
MTKSVVEANIEVHSKMADSYDRLEPHFRPENQAKVRRHLEEVRNRCAGERLLDLGCGTGFLLRLARDLFQQLDGVDVTQAMLDRVDLSSGNIRLHNSPAERVPFADNTFDAVTAYSFLHHTEDVHKVLREAFRVLKPGGVLYADLDPNKLFWDHMVEIADIPSEQLAPWVLQARDSVLETDAKVEREFGIPRDTFQKAEYSKAILGGINPRTIVDELCEMGFRTAEVQLEWYVGQAHVMHGQSFEDAEKIAAYLRKASPLTDHLFKYVRFSAQK